MTETNALDAIVNRPYLMDATPVDDGANTVRVWVRERDKLAGLHVTEVEADDDDNEIEKSVTTYLNSGELFSLGLSVGDALAALGDRAELANLIGELVQTLAKMKN